MNWKTTGLAACLTLALAVASDLGASPVFDGSNANVWVQDASGNVRSYSLGGNWTTGASVSGSQASILIEGASARALPVGAGVTSILVNQTAESLPMISPGQIPMALVGLSRGDGDPEQGDGLPAVSIQPGGGEFDGTVAVVLRAGRADGPKSNLRLNWSVNGQSQHRIFRSDDEAEVRFFLVDNDSYAIQASATQSGRTSPVASATLKISGADPMRDTDGDGIPDIVEAYFGMDPLSDDLSLDSDGDGWPDFEERLRGSDPNDPDSVPLDSDGDGWSDFDEGLRKTDPEDRFTLIDGVKVPVLYPSRPTARRLYEVETRVSGLIHCGTGRDALSKSQGLTAIGLGGAEAYDVATLPSPEQLADQPDPQLMSQLPEWLRQDLAHDALGVGALPPLRLPAGEALVLRADDGGTLRIKGVLPSFVDPTPGEVTAWLAAQGKTWETAEDWIAAYVAYLGERLVQDVDGSLGPATAAVAAIVESLIAWQLPDEVDPGLRRTLIGVPAAPADATAVQRLRRLLAAHEGDVSLLAARIAALPELAEARDAIAGIVSCAPETDTEVDAYLAALKLDDEALYFSRLLALVDVDALPREQRDALIDPNGDADGDGVLNRDELSGRDPGDPRVSDRLPEAPRVVVTDLRTRAPSSGVLHLPVMIVLDAPAGSDASLSYATGDGTAVAGDHYVARQETLRLLPGAREHQFNLQIQASAGGETESRQFTVRFGQAKNLQLVRDALTVTIDPAASVGDAPVANNDAVIVAPGSSTEIEVLANDIGSGLVVALHSLPPLGSAELLADGRIRYLAPADFIGGTSFRYRIEDGEGRYAIATVNLSSTLTPNTPPVAVADAAITDENTQVVIDVLANDSDADGDALTVALLRQPAHGTASVGAGGAIIYQPETGFVGDDNLRYAIDDGRGGRAEAEVSITVRPVAPQVSLAADLRIDEPATGSVDAVIRVSLSRAVPRTVAVSYRTIAETATAGSDYTERSGRIVFAPDQGYFDIAIPVLADDVVEEDESFRIELHDAEGLEIDRASVRITIVDGTVANRDPVAVDDEAMVSAGASVDIDVLANDSDPDGDTLTVSLPVQPDQGSAQVLTNGGIRYNAPDGFVGQVDFAYVIKDGRGGSATAMVRVTVTGTRAGFAIYGMSSDDSGDGPMGLFRVPLAVVDGEAAKPQRLTPDFPSWDRSGVSGYWISPDGRHLLYQVTESPEAYNNRYYLVRLEDEAPVSVALNPLPFAGANIGFEPHFTPDGSALVYELQMREDDFQRDLVITPLDQPGTYRSLLKAGEVRISELVVDAGGEVVYVSTQRNFSTGQAPYILSVPLDGSGGPQRLSQDLSLSPGFGYPSDLRQTGDGRWLVFRYNGGSSVDVHGGLYAIDLSAPGTAQRLTPDFNVTGGMGMGYVSYTLAPDGGRIYFVADIDETLPDGESAMHELYQIELSPPFSMKRLSMLREGSIERFVMMPDGHSLAYLTGRWNDDRYEGFLYGLDRDRPGEEQTLAGPLPGYITHLSPAPGSIGVDGVMMGEAGSAILLRSLLGANEPLYLAVGESDGGEVGGLGEYWALSDGRHVLYVKLGGDEPGLYVVDAHKPDSGRPLIAPEFVHSRVFSLQVWEPPVD